MNYYLMVSWQPEGNNMYDDLEEEDYIYDFGDNEEDDEEEEDYSQDALIEEYGLSDDEFEGEEDF